MWGGGGSLVFFRSKKKKLCVAAGIVWQKLSRHCFFSTKTIFSGIKCFQKICWQNLFPASAPAPPHPLPQQKPTPPTNILSDLLNGANSFGSLVLIIFFHLECVSAGGPCESPRTFVANENFCLLQLIWNTADGSGRSALQRAYSKFYVINFIEINNCVLYHHPTWFLASAF